MIDHLPGHQAQASTRVHRPQLGCRAAPERVLRALARCALPALQPRGIAGSKSWSGPTRRGHRQAAPGATPTTALVQLRALLRDLAWRNDAMTTGNDLIVVPGARCRCHAATRFIPVTDATKERAEGAAVLLRQGLSQHHAARVLGVSRSWIAKYAVPLLAPAERQSEADRQPHGAAGRYRSTRPTAKEPARVMGVWTA